MNRTGNQINVFENIIKKEISGSLIVLAVLTLLFVIVLILLVSWKKSINREFKEVKHKKKKNIKDHKKENLEWMFCLIMLCIVLLGAFISQGLFIVNGIFDIQNASYVVYQGDITVTTDYTLVWNGPNRTDYVISFHNGSEEVKLLSNDDIVELLPGDYPNSIVVYSYRSKILVDVDCG